MTSHAWGRVADDGTVFVKTADGERSVGQYPEGSPEVALKFFTERYDALAFEVGLLEQRINAGVLSPEEATESIKTVREQVVDGERRRRPADPGRAARRAEAGHCAAARRCARPSAPRRLPCPRPRRKPSSPRPRSSPRATTGATAPTGCASCSTSGRRSPGSIVLPTTPCGAASRPRAPRYTRRRKSHFSEQHEKRDGARVVKERLTVEAESLAGSTEWGPTSGRFRDLMKEWKAAGPAPRDVDDALWKRFRGAQDTFFGARDAASAEQDKEFAANAEVKDQLLVEAEALLPVTDLEAAKKALRDLADRWEAAGKVPRDRMKELEGRMRKVEQEIRSHEDEQWKRTDPEKSARADDMVSKLEAALADIETQLAEGQDARATNARSRSSRRTSPHARPSSRWLAAPAPTSPADTRGRSARQGVVRPGVTHRATSCLRTVLTSLSEDSRRSRGAVLPGSRGHPEHRRPGRSGTSSQRLAGVPWSAKKSRLRTCTSGRSVGEVLRGDVDRCTTWCTWRSRCRRPRDREGWPTGRSSSSTASPTSRVERAWVVSAVDAVQESPGRRRAP